MTDNWDDSDDDWDVPDDDELDARLGLKKLSTEAAPNFDDEEDLAVKEKAAAAKAQHQELKKKGNALAEKKRLEQERQEEIEIAKKEMELMAKQEANMTADELRAFKQKQIEEGDNELTADLFGGIDDVKGKQVAAASSTLELKDLRDHLKHARLVATTMKNHGKIHLASTFLTEVIQQSKDVLDDAAISDIIKVCNVIKNEKVQAAKRKVKGQAQKAQKRDKAAEARAKQVQIEAFGDSDKYDKYDEYGEDYEDAFF